MAVRLADTRAYSWAVRMELKSAGKSGSHLAARTVVRSVPTWVGHSVERKESQSADSKGQLTVVT